MNGMKRNVLSLICLACLCLPLTVPAQAPLPEFKAPLKKIESDREYTGGLQLDRRELTFRSGSKKVVFRPNGTFSIFSGTLELAKTVLFISTPFKNYQRNVGIKKVEGRYDGNGMQIRDIRTTEESIVFDGVIPWNVPGKPLIARSWKIEARIVDRKRLRVEAGFDPEPGVKLPTDSGLFFHFLNAKECSAPRLGSWIPGDGRNNMITSGKETEIRVKFARTDDGFTLTPRNRWRSWNMNFAGLPMHLRLDFAPDKLAFDLDLGRSFEEQMQIRSAAERLKIMDNLTVPARGKNLLPNPYFAGRYRFRSRTHDNITDIREYYSTDAKFGRHSMVVSPFSMFTAAVPLDPGDYVFSFYAKGPGSVVFIFRSPGRGFMKDVVLRVNSPDQWKRIEVPIHFPIENVTTIGGAPAGKNRVLIDGLQLEKGKKATPFEAPAVEAEEVNPLFYPSGKEITMEFELSTLEKEVSGKGVMTITSFFGELAAKQDFDYRVTAGSYPKLTFRPGKLPDGIYVIRLDYGGRAPEQFYRMAVMPFLKNTHFTARIFSPGYDGSREVRTDVSEAYLARLQAIGIGSTGHSRAIGHDAMRKFKKYGVVPFDFGMDFRCDSARIKKFFPDLKDVPPNHIWFFLQNKDYDYLNLKSALLPDYRLVGGWNADYRKKFIETVKEQIRKYPEFPAYYIGSEAPHEFKDDPHYPDLFAAFREAVKSVYPKAMVYEGGEPSMDYGSPGIGVDYTDKLLGRLTGKARADLVNIHTYTKNIRQLYRNFRGLAAMMKKHPDYADSPIALAEGMHFYPYHISSWNTEHVCWCGEGWKGNSPSYDLGWHEKLSAAYFARAWLIFMTEYRRLWCATSSASNTGNFALDVSLSPRAFQKIPNTLGVLLGNPKRYLGDFTFAPETKCLVWEDELGRPLAAVWNEDPAVDAGTKDAPKARLDYPGAEYIDLMGVPRKPAKVGEFAVSPFPLFIRGRAGDSERFTKALSAAVLADPDRMPCHIGFEILPGNRVKLLLVNQVSRELSGSLTMFGREHPFRIPRTGEISLLTDLPEPIGADRVGSIRIPYLCKVDGRTFRRDLNIHCFEVKKFAGDWSRIPVIRLTNQAGLKGFSAGDFSASYQLAWDEKKMRLRVKVKDNVFAPGNKAGYRWNYDVLQVYFDTRCSALKNGTTQYDEDDYEYGFMPTMDGKRCEVWRARSPDIQLTFGIAAPKNNVIATEIPAKFTRTPDGYIYEAEFPADCLLPMKLVKGCNFAFGLFAGDRDDSRGAVKGLSNASRPGSGCHNQPHLWPVGILTE